ncbi:PAS domain-containing protein [Mycolicibacterium vaccae]|uniref:PAS domain-containing protein n=1 Tax=Mycolicibacterium vaccae TaxID=1810 RepID=UPI003CE7A5AF
MSQDWLLVETLGAEPVVVAEGVHTRDLIPINRHLRRNPHLMAIQTAISETVRGGTGLSSITPKSDRVIRTEVVQMSDGVIHGVHIWLGSVDVEPPPRPLVGPLIWDLTDGTATDTTESLRVGGWDPNREALQGRAFVDDLPRRDLNPYEAKVLGVMIKPEPGVTICSTWDVNDYQGQPITVGFVSRTLLDVTDGGAERVICRAMNWRSVRDGNGIEENLLAQRILDGLAEPGMHRALVDPAKWTLLKWLDEPPPFFDWRVGLRSAKVIHPQDRDVTAAMAQQFANGPASGVVRLADRDGAWTPVHVTVHRVELDDGVLAGLAVLRAPTPEETAEVEQREQRPPRPLTGWRRGR